MSPIARFLTANRRMSKFVEDRLPAGFRHHLHTLYKYEVAALVNRRPGQVVLDIGGGKDCPFLPFVSDPAAHLIVAVDYSADELRRNRALDRKIVADAAAAAFPFRNGAVDILASRSVVEHLHDNAAFFANCARVLRPGGVLAHAFPCKFTPFSVINQLVPNWLARRLLAYFHPQWQDECGFPAYYDHCYFSAMRALLARNGFENAKFTFRYYQSIYYDFFFPLYIVMLSYDLLVWRLGIRNLACAILVTAERPPDERGGGDRTFAPALEASYP